MVQTVNPHEFRRDAAAWLLGNARRLAPNRGSALLEIGVIADDDNDYVIHPRDARPTQVPEDDPTQQKRPAMSAKKHPRELTAGEAEVIVAAFDDHADADYSVTDNATLNELRAAAASRREAEARIEAAALAAHRAGLSWGAIGAQLGMTRQGARQRFERLVTH